MRNYTFLTFVFAIMLGTVGIAFAQKGTAILPAQKATSHDHMMMQHDQMMMNLQTGKTGDLKIQQPTTIGDVTLQPGDYEVQHVSSPAGHYLQISRVSWNEVRTNAVAGSGYSWAYTELVRQPVARLNCDLKPLNAKVTSTKLLASTNDKIVGLEIRGENVEHVF